MREIIAEMKNDDRKARYAFEVFTYRVKKYIGAYAAAMGGVDAVVFTGGIGENSHEVTLALKSKLEEIKTTLPPGVTIQSVYDRTELVDHVIDTVRKNLFEGGLLVIAVLFMFLGRLRALGVKRGGVHSDGRTQRRAFRRPRYELDDAA